MFRRVLQIYGEKTHQVEDSLGTYDLYPAGTERVVREYFIFLKTVNGEKRRGSQEVVQVAKVLKSWAGSDTGFVQSNEWKDTRFLDKRSLDTHLQVA